MVTGSPPWAMAPDAESAGPAKGRTPVPIAASRSRLRITRYLGPDRLSRRRNRQDGSGVPAARLDEGEEQQDEREQVLRAGIAVFDPEPLVVIGHRDEGILRRRRRTEDL